MEFYNFLCETINETKNMNENLTCTFISYGICMKMLHLTADLNAHTPKPKQIHSILSYTMNFEAEVEAATIQTKTK